MNNISITKCESGNYLAYYMGRIDIIGHGENELKAVESLNDLTKQVLSYETENEAWVEIPGFPQYKASNLGRIKSLHKRNGSFNIMKQWPAKQGYFRIGLKRDKKHFCCRVHRLIALSFIANPDNKPEVNHKNALTCDNRVDNLEWATPIENMKHAKEMGLLKPHLNGLQRRKPIRSINEHGEIVKYVSIIQAAKNGFCYSSIRRALTLNKKYKNREWLFDF